MSVITNAGKVSDIFVNHNGVIKPVQSGWVNQNGVAVPFYKKGGGGLPFIEETFTRSKSTMSADVTIRMVEFDITNVSKLAITGSFSSSHYSPKYTGTTYMYFRLIKDDGTILNSISYAAVSKTSTESKNLNTSLDVTKYDGQCALIFYNATQTKYLTYNITVRCE